jgi:hypothetical protein
VVKIGAQAHKLCVDAAELKQVMPAFFEKRPQVFTGE